MRGQLGSTKVGGREGIQKHTLGGQIFTRALTEYFFFKLNVQITDVNLGSYNNWF